MNKVCNTNNFNLCYSYEYRFKNNSFPGLGFNTELYDRKVDFTNFTGVTNLGLEVATRGYLRATREPLVTQRLSYLCAGAGLIFTNPKWFLSISSHNLNQPLALFYADPMELHNIYVSGQLARKILIGTLNNQSEEYYVMPFFNQ
ncbi:MAG: type IX secretion system membrane protein PorP/SprF [Bacteroidetes bacterium]|nr:type IX secretion system membrane protein PorP/SprF [Bacteroidota bacterium]